MDFLLRPFVLQDAECLANNANNKKVARFLTDQFPSPYTIDDATSFIEMSLKQTPSNIIAIDIEGQVAGGIGLHLQADIYKNNAELGYWLAEQYWGKGIMTKAVQRMVIYGFKYFELNRIYARPFGNNIGSQRVLEKSGFKLEARLSKTLVKNDVLLDELIYAERK